MCHKQNDAVEVQRKVRCPGGQKDPRGGGELGHEGSDSSFSVVLRDWGTLSELRSLYFSMNSISMARLLCGFNPLMYVNNLQHYLVCWITVVLTMITNVCCAAFINNSNSTEARIQTLAYIT